MDQNISGQANTQAAFVLCILIIIPISAYIGQLLLGIISVVIIFWLLMIVDCLQRNENNFPHKGNNEKLIWIITLIFLNAAGAILYFILVLNNYKKKSSTPVLSE